MPRCFVALVWRCLVCGLAACVFVACGEAQSSDRAPLSFSVATWNVFLRPPDLEGGILPKSDPFCRAEQAGHLIEQFEPKLDFVGLQEMLDPALQTELLAAAPSYPVTDGPRPMECERDGPCAIQPGGLTAIARPSLSLGETIAKGYADCQGSDCLANKGVFYLPVRLRATSVTEEQVDLHVLVTHLQAASGEVPASEVRASQFAEIRETLETRVCNGTAPTAPVIVLGDLNTAFVAEANAERDNSEYDAAREALSLSCLGAPIDVFDDQPDAPGSFNCIGGQVSEDCDEPPFTVRVDHIWYWPASETLTLETATIEPGATDVCETAFISDHRLVHATFSLR